MLLAMGHMWFLFRCKAVTRGDSAGVPFAIGITPTRCDQHCLVGRIAECISQNGDLTVTVRVA